MSTKNGTRGQGVTLPGSFPKTEAKISQNLAWTHERIPMEIIPRRIRRSSD